MKTYITKEKVDDEMIKILIVEDEKAISNLIQVNLTDAGYHCSLAYDGKTAANLLETDTYDLVLLDIMLPEINGYELMEYIKPMEIPVIFITAKADVLDRVKGLQLGAEDYITKPFEIIELLARVEVVLRRFRKSNKKIEVGDIVIDTDSRQVTKGGEIVNLTMKEYSLLLLFVRNQNIALFREIIFKRVWESDFIGDSRTVDLHVQRLRKKLGWENKIKSVYKVGYRLEV